MKPKPNLNDLPVKPFDYYFNALLISYFLMLVNLLVWRDLNFSTFFYLTDCSLALILSFSLAIKSDACLIRYLRVMPMRSLSSSLHPIYSSSISSFSLWSLVYYSLLNSFLLISSPNSRNLLNSPGLDSS
jgi:hypothetical protein